ncbi:chromate efflux transporter [Staphylococcus delphini]|uniref:ChrA protein n=1 Tax=Staphylococcus delphini TaxID=53344 RepID=A0AAX0QW78_9STAP|nr:chromate efflux transporter [Staphylococcus delphini]PCF52636.1 ChrA protein [Staphylococcus delphini]PNZ96447.1 ChrA protein [Staphylococcus delphini]RIZ56508.1 ChrA protein [Staphylococcus delphini]VED64010.1 chromate transporter, chromate ion transporter (CHR) family [Staphylococcus delphini]
MYKYINIFVVALKLGLISFGGPTAHLGYFYDEYVKKRKWLDEKEYSDLVALCQFLPGPASSQVGIGIGTIRGGVWGGIISFIGFTLPSVIILMIFSTLFTNSDTSFTWMQGLKLVAVAIVAQAIIGMGKKLADTKTTVALALFVLILSLVINNIYIQVIGLSITGVYGLVFLKQNSTNRTKIKNKLFTLPKSLGFVSLSLFFLLLTVLPIASSMTNHLWLKMFDSFYRSGSLVFGGGHVVLPLLKNEFVPSGLISPDNFITGYAAAQAVPGPLFTFASYIGMSIESIGGAILATIAIFLPAFLLLFGILPFWDNIKSNIYAEGFLKGISAGVVGILIAAFYNPIWTSTIQSELDFALASLLFVLLMYFKMPSWAIVLVGIILGVLFY